MIEVPVGYVSLRTVAIEIGRFIGGAVSAQDYRREELKSVTFGQTMAWHDFAVRSYIAHVVRSLEIPVYVSHSTLAPSQVETNPPLVPLFGAELWADKSTSSEVTSPLSDARREHDWVRILIDRTIGTDPPPSLEAWTADKTRDGRTMLFKKSDADRIRAAFSGATERRPGRPYLQDRALQEYERHFPDGHKAAQVPWKVAAVKCGVSVDTLRRALKGKKAAK